MDHSATLDIEQANAIFERRGNATQEECTTALYIYTEIAKIAAPYTRKQAGDCLMKAGELALLLKPEDYNEAIIRTFEMASKYYTLGKYYKEACQAYEALLNYYKSEKNHHAAAVTQQSKAKILEMDKQFVKAAEMYEEASTSYSFCNGAFSERLKALHNASFCYIKEKKYEKVLDTLTQIEERMHKKEEFPIKWIDVWLNILLCALLLNQREVLSRMRTIGSYDGEHPMIVFGTMLLSTIEGKNKAGFLQLKKQNASLITLETTTVLLSHIEQEAFQQ